MMPLIAGGGPAGAAAALWLAQGGAAPRLLERSRDAHDVVCGAFLGWDAVAGLAALGIDVAALGAHAIGRVRIVAGGRRIETALPHAAVGLSRHRLDAVLLGTCGRGGSRDRTRGRDPGGERDRASPVGRRDGAGRRAVPGDRQA